MILQREQSIPVWGNSNPGDTIRVELANNYATTTANKYGEWKIQLPAMSTGGPFEMKVFITDKKKPLHHFKDVLIGDVWFASGQSNMEWQVIQSEKDETNIPKAYNANIRLFKVPHNKSVEPLKNTLEHSWQIADSNSVKEFSAIAYYFAHKIEKDIDVPIGIIQATWGGTCVESWMSRDALMANDLTRPRIKYNDTITKNHFIKDSTDLIKFWDIVYHPQNGSDTIISHPNYNDKNWTSVMVPGIITEWEPQPYEGIIWLRKQIKLGSDFKGKELSLNLGHPEMNYSLYFNGKEICKNQWNANISHTYAIPANVVNKGMNTISLRMAALWGGGGLNKPTKDIYITNKSDTINLTGKWKMQKDLEPLVPKINYYEWFPMFLYNGMINPVISYGTKGYLWYQGESNDTAAYNYRNILPTLINDWRIRSGQGYQPFIIMQLPNYMKLVNKPTGSNWAVMRESQEKTLLQPNTALNCIIDLGETNNIHPTNKIAPAERLALVAEKMVYNMDVVAYGPRFKSYAIEGNKIRIRFKNNGSKLLTKNNETLQGFAIAGDDQKFYWANAEIDRNEVVVFSDKVKHPVAVRYAFENNPNGNLTNQQALPAWPFRTDSWKVVTQP